MQTGARGKGKGAVIDQHAFSIRFNSKRKQVRVVQASFRCFVTVGRSLGCTFHGLIAIAISHEHEPFMNQDFELELCIRITSWSSLPRRALWAKGWVP